MKLFTSNACNSSPGNDADQPDRNHPRIAPVC
jgi:hypothetical protein